MSTDLLKRFNFVCGLICFIVGCAFLIFLYIVMQNNIISIGGIVGSISVLAFVILLFYVSINSFIKYGIAKGIDYALEQQKPITMKDVDNRIDEILKTSDKKKMCNS